MKNTFLQVFLTVLLFTALKKVATSRVLNLSTSIYHYILRSTRFDIKGRAGDSDKKEPHGARDERGGARRASWCSDCIVVSTGEDQLLQ